MAAEMMGKMSPEDMEKMMEMGKNMRGGAAGGMVTHLVTILLIRSGRSQV